LIFKYCFSKSTISNSFLLEGLSFLEKFTAFLSKKYRPVIAKFDLFFFGFSTILIIFLFLISITPYFSGLLT